MGRWGCRVMHKLIHVTDPHIVPPGDLLYGIDPGQRLRAVLIHIGATHGDAKAILMTGANGPPIRS